MLCSISFSLYCVLTLLTPFSSPEVATTPTTLLMRNRNSLVDIYIWDLCVYKWDFDVYEWHFYVDG
jgi:hypothetical protein